MPISRSVATISTPSCFASIKIFERIGIVLRFSTTPWTRWRPVKSSTRPIRSFIISSPWRSPSRSQDLLLQTVQRGTQCTVVVFRFYDLLAGMDDRRVVFASELPPDLGIRGVRELPTKIHGDLSRMHQRFAAATGFQVGDLHMEARAHCFLNIIHRHDLFLGADQIPKHALGHLQRDRLAGERSIGAEAYQGTLELADIALHRCSEKLDDIFRQRDALVLGLFP